MPLRSGLIFLGLNEKERRMTKRHLTLQSRLGAVAIIGVMVMCSSCTEHAKTEGESKMAETSSNEMSPANAAKPPVPAEPREPIREQILTLSAQAADQLRSMRDKGKLKEQAIVRIRVVPGNIFRFKGGDQQRYRYSMLLDDELTDLGNFYLMESQGLKIAIDKESGEFLRGTEVMWIESGGRAGFIFRNPNEITGDAAARDDDRTPVPANVKRTTPTPLVE
jgi:Fe-S cluster assembly iron-binding protein IscA